MIKTSLKNISNITHGLFIHSQNIIINKIVIDSRKIVSGCLFVAIVGHHFDGHNFCKESIKKGCSALLVQKQLPIFFPQIIVKDTIIALGQIALWNRLQVNPLTIAITGSTGKTSVKEITASILSSYDKTLCTKSNFNNHIGVPLTLLNLNFHHKFLIVEIGGSKIGEINYLSKLVQPCIILINNIYPVHLENFCSMQGVSMAKQEIFSGLTKYGTAILNADSNDWNTWKKKLKNKSCFFFSTKKFTHFFAYKIKIYSNLSFFFIKTPKNNHVPINLSLPGKHNVSNALAAITIATILKVPMIIIQKTLSSIQNIPKRLQFIRLNKHITIIDDSYNSNIHSVISAIEILKKISGFKILIIGDMKELGMHTIKYHKLAKKIVYSAKINKVISIGYYSKIITNKTTNGKHFYNTSDVIPYLKNNIYKIHQKTTILFKSSRNYELDSVINFILKENN